MIELCCILIGVCWTQIALFAWASYKWWRADQEKEEAINWCAAHMLYEKENGFPLMESQHMGIYFHRAKILRKKLSGNQKNRGRG